MWNSKALRGHQNTHKKQNFLGGNPRTPITEGGGGIPPSGTPPHHTLAPPAGDRLDPPLTLWMTKNGT